MGSGGNVGVLESFVIYSTSDQRRALYDGRRAHTLTVAEHKALRVGNLLRERRNARAKIAIVTERRDVFSPSRGVVEVVVAVRKCVCDIDRSGRSFLFSVASAESRGVGLRRSSAQNERCT